GGSSPHQPFHFRPHSPRTGPNMLRPMMNALAVVISTISARFSSGVSANQACSLSPQPLPPSSPSGRSSAWLSPAVSRSADSVVPQPPLPGGLVIALLPPVG